MTSIVKHYRIQKDGSLKFIGTETTHAEERKGPPVRGKSIDAETARMIGEIAYDGSINPDDRE